MPTRSFIEFLFVVIMSTYMHVALISLSLIIQFTYSLSDLSYLSLLGRLALRCCWSHGETSNIRVGDG